MQQLTGPTFGALSTPTGAGRTDLRLSATRQRTAEVLVIPDASMTDVEGSGPGDAGEVLQGQHRATISGRNIRAFTVLHLTPEDFAKDVTITDDQVKRRIRRPARRNSRRRTSREVEQVVVQDQAKADKIEEAVKGGTAFADAVKQVTGGDPVDARQGAPRTGCPPEIAEQVFAAGGRTASPTPLKSPFGIHVVHVISIRARAPPRRCDEVKDQLRHDLALAQGGRCPGSRSSSSSTTRWPAAPRSKRPATKLKLKVQKLDAVDSAGKDARAPRPDLNPDIAAAGLQTTEAGNQRSVDAVQRRLLCGGAGHQRRRPADAQAARPGEGAGQSRLAGRGARATPPTPRPRRSPTRSRSGDLADGERALGLDAEDDRALHPRQGRSGERHRPGTGRRAVRAEAGRGRDRRRPRTAPVVARGHRHHAARSESSIRTTSRP